MAAFDLVFRNAVIISSAEMQQADLAVTGETIVAIGRDLPPGRVEVDCGGQWLIPGGVDSHIHLDQPLASGAEIADDLDSGTASALAGGTTSLIGFAVQQKGSGPRKAVEAMMEKGRKKARCDFGFHLQMTDAAPEWLAELPGLAAEGHRSVKLFMAGGTRLDDGGILEVFATVRDHGVLACIHAENHELIAFLTRRLLAQGNRRPEATLLARPELGEREATSRIVALAEALDMPIQVFHISGEPAAAEIARAKARGSRVWAETCTQYLVFTDRIFHQPGMEGAKYLFSPCPRGEDAAEALWLRIADHTIECVTSDHSPTSFSGAKGKLHAGPDASFDRIPNGIPGLAARLPLVFTKGVAEGRIDPMRFVDLVSTAPAKRFGLWPRKGALAIGSDADIVLWNPHTRRTLTNATMQHGADYTPYEGVETIGAPEAVWLRGALAWKAGEVIAAPGSGRFLARDPVPAPEQLRPQAGFDPLAPAATGASGATS